MNDNNNANGAPTWAQQQQTALNELSTLNRVFHRLAMVDSTDKLEQVLDKLLPRLLKRMGDNQQQQKELSSAAALQESYGKIHTKLVEMMSHVMKRVREDKNCKLPCEGILALLVADEQQPTEAIDATIANAKTMDAIPEAVNPFTLNLALAFLTMGVPRCARLQIESLLPGLLLLLGEHVGIQSLQTPSKRSQSHQIAHLVLRAIECMTTLTNTATTITPTTQQQQQQQHQKSLPPSSTLAGVKMNMADVTASSSTEINLHRIRDICRRNETTAAALYDLLLDALLYVPSSGSLPPDGLSQAGHERLMGGASTLAKDWAAEMTFSSRLRDMKLSVLDFISPSRRFAPFLSSSATEQQDSLGNSRTIALLVAASGSEHLEVAERASTFLKIYLDSFRGKEQGFTFALGDPVALSCGLLSLTLGQSNAGTIWSTTNTEEIPKLGTSMPASTPATLQLVLSLHRRRTSDKVSSAISGFVATKILEDCPQSFDTIAAIQSVGRFAVVASQQSLSNLGTSSGLSLLRASPFVSSAQLLNALCIRLVGVYDSSTDSQAYSLQDLMALSLSIVCKVLAGASSSRPVSNKRCLRDSCYGVICTLSRSRFALCKEGYLFTCGSIKESDTTTLAVSIDTVSLLFGCASNEHETLRPRAVAALDALLGAYCRVLVDNNNENVSDSKTSPVVSNPWASAAPQAPMVIVDDSKERLSKALLPLLWTASQTTQPKASRMAAARWSSDLLRFLDLPQACHILCVLAGDPDVTVSAIAREALGLKNINDEDVVRPGSESTILPGLSDLTNTLFSSRTAEQASWRPTYNDFSYRGRSAALRLGLVCLLSDMYVDTSEAVQTYVAAVANTITLFDPRLGASASSRGREAIELFEEASICLSWSLATSKIARSNIASGSLPLGREDVERLSVAADSSTTRRYLAKAAGSLYEDISLWGEGGDNILLWLEKTQLVFTLEKCAGNLERNQLSTSEIHGSAFLGAQCVRAFRLRLAERPSTIEKEFDSSWEAASKLIGLIGQGMRHADEIVGNSFSDALFTALSFEGSDAPILDPKLFPGTSKALIDLDYALRKYSNGDHANPTRASKLAYAAGVCLAASTSGAGVGLGEGESSPQESAGIGRSRLQCAMTLFTLLGTQAYQKDEELALTVGEALAHYADAYSPRNVVWSSEVTVWPEIYDEAFAQALPPHQQVPYILLRKESKSSSPQKRVACAPALLGVVGRAARAVNHDPNSKNRSLVKELIKHLDEMQTAFITILADPKCNHLARESCCLGLAACYGLAEATSGGDGGGGQQSRSMELNEKLLRSFGQTTRFSGSLYMETAEQAAERRRAEGVANRAQGSNTAANATEEGENVEAEVGGVSGLGEAALGAFREMASAAVSLGRPDVLYALLMLSVSHPVWFTSGPRERYSKASLLGETSILGSGGTSAIELGDALRPHLGKLIPRLLRARHDPNKQTRAQMGALWNGLTRGGLDARLTISEHFLPTLDVLLEDASSSKLWRARVGACGALVEILGGRSWDEFGGGSAILDDDEIFAPTNPVASGAAIRLIRLWRAVVRELDDVRLAVREAGEALGRAVRALTIRLCDPSAAKNSNESNEVVVKRERHAIAAAGTSLRWLVTHGLKQPVPEASGICLSCLVAIIDIVPPRILQPVLCDLIGHLLMAMSSLEPAALNYLQVRTTLSSDQAEAYNRLESIRLQLSQNSPLASALSKCLDMVPSLDVSMQRSVVPQLDSALRRGVGFATRAATADAVSSLCNSCPNAFQFPGTSTANPSVRLLRALYFASERERGQSARDRMTHALGNLARVSPGSSVRSLALRACERYSTSYGNHDDPLARRAAAAALRSMVVRASNQVSESGSGDIWCRRILPTAFLGRKDEDAKVASLWQEVWDEGGSALGSNEKEFGTLIEEKLLPYLVDACKSALTELSWFRRVAAARALADLCDLNVLAPAPRSVVAAVATRSDGARAKRRAQAANVALGACVEIMIRSRLWTGKAEVVAAAVKIASKWSSPSCDALGWDSQRLCPWTPITVSPRQYDNDLFVGDAWFLSDQEELETLIDASPAKDAEEGESIQVEQNGDQPIDFEEGEKILDQESLPSKDVQASVDNVRVVTFSGLCRVLLDQGFPLSKKSSLSLNDDFLPYKAASLKGFADLTGSLAEFETSRAQVKYLYELLASRLIAVVDSDNIFGFMDTTETSHAPVIVARTIDCLASTLWEGIGSDGNAETVMKLATLFKIASGRKQPAWSVREAATLGAARLAFNCDIEALRRSETVLILMDCTKQSLADRKYWRVRVAGLKILRSLVNRTSTTDHRVDSQGKQLVLETMLPFKEDFLKLLRSTLSDTEPQVTSLSTEILRSMAWWP